MVNSWSCPVHPLVTRRRGVALGLVACMSAGPGFIAATSAQAKTAAASGRVAAVNEPVNVVRLDGPSGQTQVTTSDKVRMRADIRSGVRVSARFVVIAVRDSQGRNFDLGKTGPVVIDKRVRTISGQRKLPAGTYRYRVGYRAANGAWSNLGDVRVFTVAPATPRPNPPATETPVKESRWSMGYFVGYLHRRYPLESVNWNALTHMAVGAAIPRSDGSVDTTFFQDDIKGPAWAKSVVAAAHANDRKAILMLGGGGNKPGFMGALSDAKRDQFVANILTIVDEYGFDGVDVDLEPLVEADGPQLVAFAKALRAARPQLLLTLPVSAVNVNRPVQTQLTYVRLLPQYFDQINVMSYGLANTWRGWSSWHTTPLSGEKPTTPMSVSSSVESYLAAGIPAKKLGMGLGLYGACYRGVTGPNQTSSRMARIAGDNKMSLNNIMRDYYRSSAVKWDANAQVPYLSSPTPLGPLGCTFVPYEDARSLSLKLDYARSKQLGGLIIWNVNEGYIAPETGEDALLGLIQSRFLK